MEHLVFYELLVSPHLMYDEIWTQSLGQQRYERLEIIYIREVHKRKMLNVNIHIKNYNKLNNFTSDEDDRSRRLLEAKEVMHFLV